MAFTTAVVLERIGILDSHSLVGSSAAWPGLPLATAVVIVVVADILFLLVAVIAAYTSGLLKRSREQMRLQKSELEERVRERTAELTEANRQLHDEVRIRRETEEGLRESEERYRNLVDSISDVLFTHDLGGKFLSVNRSVVRSVGYSPQELVGKVVSDFMPAKFRPAFHSEYLVEVRGHGYHEGVIVFLAKNGEPRYIEYRNTLVEVPGEGSHVSGSGRDVTERVVAQNEVSRLQQQLAQAQKMEAIGTLASGIAHDFNNLLQVMAGYVEVLLVSDVDRERRKMFLQEIDGACARGGELVRRLQTFSRKVRPELRPVDVNQQVEESVRVLERTLPKMVSIELELAPGPMMADGDPTQLEQIIMNLGINARDAMPEGGSLRVATRRVNVGETTARSLLEVDAGEYVVLDVADDGEGMDAKTLEHMYEPFYTTKPVGKGTGLGLSTVYGIVRGHRGYMTCDSAPGKGTTFSVYLPALLDLPPVRAVAEKVARPSTAHVGRILVVDDEVDILTIAQEALEAAGHTVLTAGSGEQALDVYREEGAEIDLVILDLGMPGMGGLRCLDELLGIEPSARVVVASGYAADRHVEEAVSAGARRFIPKPYRLSVLCETVQEVLDQE